MRGLAAVMTAGALLWAGRADAATITERAGGIELANAFVARTIGLGDEAGLTTRWANPRRGQVCAVESEEFRLRLRRGDREYVLTGRDAPGEPRVISRGPTATVVVRWRFEEPGVQVEAVHQLVGAQAVMRKYLLISSTGGEDLVLLDVEVERLRLGPPPVEVQGVKLEPPKPTLAGGLGKPVFIASFFAGLEYPMGEASVRDGILVLAHHPGRPLGGDRLQTKTAVLGAAGTSETVSDAFLGYVAGIRPDAGKPLRHYVVQKQFLVGRTFKCEEFIAAAQQFRDKLYEPHGVAPDGLNVWNYYLHGPGLFAWDTAKFPEGFGPLRRVLDSFGVGLGIWVSFYCHEGCDLNWGAQQGYEVDHPERGWLGGSYCLAGPRYYEDYSRRVLELVRENNVQFMHIDFNRFDCSAADHGHLPGAYGREARMDAEIRLLTALREVNPDLFLMMGCGSYKSPWLLQYFDVIWPDLGGDTGLCDVPAAMPRDNEITLRDIHYRARMLEEPEVYMPTWGWWTHEPLFNRGEAAARAAELAGLSLQEKWEDNVVMDMSRGTRCWAMHFDTELMNASEGNWRWLASAMKWARAHHPLMTRTWLVGGDPAKEEVYGYAHADHERVIITVHNPSSVTQDFEIGLGEALSLRPERLALRTLYPYQVIQPEAYRVGQIVRRPVPGNQVMVFEFCPVEEVADLPVGVPFRFDDAGRCVLLELPGSEAEVRRGIEDEATKVRFPGRVSRPEVGRLEVERVGQAIRGRTSVALEDGQGELVVTLRFAAAVKQLPAAQFRLDGQETAVTAVAYAPTPSPSVQQVPTKFVVYRLPVTGRRQCEFGIEFGRPFYDTRVEAVLRAYLPVVERPCPWPVDQRDGTMLLAPHDQRGVVLSVLDGGRVTVEGTRRPMTATSSSCWQETGHEPWRAVDGVPATFWTSATTKDEWLELDLGQETAVKGVSVLWYAPWKVGHYKIEVWRDGKWAEIVDRTDEDGRGDEAGPYSTQDSFEPVRTTRVRLRVLTVNPGSANTAVREIEVLTDEE